MVIGASGAIGRFALPRLLAAGHDVLAVSRAPRASVDPHLRWEVGDLDSAPPPLPVLEAIFSLGPLDAFARWFARADIAGAPRVIAFGSMSVDTKRGSSDADERALADRLQQAECTLIGAADARGCAWTILRPTLIYGAGIDRSLTPIAHFAQRWHAFPRIAGAHGLRQPVHADDLAAACLGVLSHPQTAAHIYPLGGGEQLSFSAMLERVHASLATWSVPLPIPLGVARALIKVARRPRFPGLRPAALERLTRDLVVDHSAAIADFGWAPRPFHPTSATWTAAPTR